MNVCAPIWYCLNNLKRLLSFDFNTYKKKKRKEKNSWIVETVLDDIFWVYVLAGIRLLM